MSKYSSNFIYKDSSTNHNICIYRHEFDRNIKFVNDRKRRALAAELAMHGQGQWSDRDVELLLEELEIEVGEGTNRFLYEDERISYCLYLSQVIQFDDNKSADTIYEQIIWLWSTWEAISRATGKSWWNISERDKYLLSLSENDQGTVYTFSMRSLPQVA